MRLKRIQESRFFGQWRDAKGNDRVLDLWRDAAGNDNMIVFNKRWGSHAFSDMEVEALLEGKVITFAYKNEPTSGHLQYIKWDKGVYFGFCPNKYNKEYNEAPVFDSNVGSRYEIEETKLL